MPFVRISLLKGHPEGFGKKAGEIVYQSMLSAINIPLNDHFQVISEHDRNELIYDRSFLDIPRTDGFMFIQIFLNEGRTVELKRKLYKTIADSLHKELNVQMEDVFINLVEVKKENWSFGNGVAQLAQ
jgi:phenylpyruvate tautomerase PptA (4-oxalocrotonate tautomerase family)